MDAMLLRTFKQLTLVEKKQKEDQKFHYGFSDKAMNSINSSKIMPVLSDAFFKDENFYIVKHPRFATYPLHSHTFFVINYVISGRITEIINGHKLTLKKGDILLINIGTDHKILAPRQNDIMLNISFHPDISSHFQLSQNIPFLIFKQEKTNKSMRQTLDLLIYEYFNPRKDTSLIMNNYFENILMMMSRDLQLSKADFNRSGISIAEMLLTEINNHYDTTSLSKIAKELNYNSSYLGTLFKEKFGKSFHSILIVKRMTIAYQAVLLTSYSIEKISRKVGFSNRTSFYKYFKQQYGCTPKQLRDKQTKRVM